MLWYHLLEIDRKNKKRRRSNQSQGHKDFNVENPPMRREKSRAPVSHNFHYFRGAFTRTL
jgi:hypothetical protein